MLGLGKSFASILVMVGSFIYLIIASEFICKLIDKSKSTYSVEKYMLALIITSILFGVLLGVEAFVRELVKEGRVKINILKILALVIVFLPVFVYVLILVGIKVSMPLIFQRNAEFLVPGLCILVGYNLTTVYKKLEI